MFGDTKDVCIQSNAENMQLNVENLVENCSSSEKCHVTDMTCKQRDKNHYCKIIGHNKKIESVFNKDQGFKLRRDDFRDIENTITSK